MTDPKLARADEPLRAPMARTWLPAAALAALVAGCGGGTEPAMKADPANGRAQAAAASPSNVTVGTWAAVTPSPDPDGRAPDGSTVVPAVPPIDRPTPTDTPGVSTPVAAANLPDGRVLLWAADGRFSFDANITGNTWSGVFDPATNVITPFNATVTGHNMFCPGTTNLPDGRLLISGGIDSKKTTIYDATAAAGVNDAARWSSSGLMNIARAYQANTLLADGSILTLGGSWDGNGVVIATPKNGEKWDPVSGQWSLLRGLLSAPMIGIDPEDAVRGGAYRGDNHMWLIPTGWGNVLHAGPAPNMNWIDTRGEGASVPAGTRGDDTYSIAGTTVMYAPGRILKAGGAGAYDYTKSPGGTAYDANNRAYVIDTNTLTTDGSPTVTVTGNPGMTASRVFHNAVVLPNGQVFIVGGQERALLFNDAGARLEAEIWDPDTGAFTAVGTAMTIPRNYHSVAILLPDARVLVGGGGLGGAGPFNHANLEIFTPHYLLDNGGNPVARPAITAPVAPVGTNLAATAEYGSTLAVTTNTAVTSFALVRLSSATHSVNNDQRRIPLDIVSTAGTTYTLQIPRNRGIALPGLYMLFAMNAQGVPSVSQTIRVGTATSPSIATPGIQNGVVGQGFSLDLAPLVTGGGAGATTFSIAPGTPLPTGLTLSGSTISGTPTAAGSPKVTVRATKGGATVEVDVLFRIAATAATGADLNKYRFFKLEKPDNSVGAPTAAIAEFHLLNANGQYLSRDGWGVWASSEQNGTPATLAIDGNRTSKWETSFNNPIAAVPPHYFVVNLPAPQQVGGFALLQRQDGETSGNWGNYNFYGSNDGVSWTLLQAGTLGTAGAGGEITARIAGAGGGVATPGTNLPPSVAQVANQASAVNVAVAPVQVLANDPNVGDTLVYSATGLPTGVTINPTTGQITGTPTAPVGVYAVTVTVRDRTVADPTGAAVSVSFNWSLATTVTVVPGTERYVRLEVTSVAPIPAQPWATAASVWPLSGTGAVLDRTGWTATTSSRWSSCGTSDATCAGFAIDNDPGTFWHTLNDPNLDPTDPGPRTLTIDMGAAPAGGTRVVGGFRYLPRQQVATPGGVRETAGDITGYRLSVSVDGVSWTLLREGTLTIPAGFNLPVDVRINFAPLLATFTPPATVRGVAIATQTLSATDANGDTVTYAVTGLPPGLSFNATTRQITGTPTLAGTYAVQITATDNASTPASATATVSWVVSPPPNTPPVINTPATQSTQTGTAVNLPISASDVDGNPLTFSATGLPAGLSISTSGVISGTVTAAGGTSATVVVSVSDGTAAAVSTQPFTWNVTAAPPVNRAPVITNPGTRSVQRERVASIPMVASDPDGQTLAYSASGLPAGLSINGSTGVISGTLSAAATLGDSTVTVTVSDGQTPPLSASATFVVRVLPADTANRAPTIAPVTAQVGVRGQAIAPVNVSATDPDGDALVYSATGLPSGVSINPLTGVITGTVSTAATLETTTVTVTATDTRGLTGSTTFGFTVNAEAAPPAAGGGGGGGGALGVGWLLALGLAAGALRRARTTRPEACGTDA